jgi:tRNA(Ile)-lysidine synthase
MQLDPDWVTQQGEDAVLLHFVDVAFRAAPRGPIGIAVSGGGDSMALLHLFARWSVQTGHPIAAVTVDHGLRAQSGAEAQGVAAHCAQAGIPHDILTWQGRQATGNISAAARDARYGLMAAWAASKGIEHIALGHTADDSAENFLMRLGRSAGIDGLAGMQTRFERNGILWARPLWRQRRSALRDYLLRHDVQWVEDPSNDDPRYLRTRARKALPLLEDLGVTVEAVHASAFALREAQTALVHYTQQEARLHVTQEAGDLIIPERRVPPIPSEIERRLVTAALQWVGSNAYPPRGIWSGLLDVDVADHQRKTIAGCLIMKRKGQFRITREYNAVTDMVTSTDALWDTRWRVEGPHAPDLELRALGEGVMQLPDWRATGLPRPTLMASPAVWRGETLVAAPLAGYNSQWSVRIVADFTSFLVSH